MEVKNCWRIKEEVLMGEKEKRKVEWSAQKRAEKEAVEYKETQWIIVQL